MSAGLGATVCLRHWRWSFPAQSDKTIADNNLQLGKLGT